MDNKNQPFASPWMKPWASTGILVLAVFVLSFFPALTARAEEPLYGRSVDKSKLWSVSQPTGTPPADGYIRLRSGDSFVRKKENGAFEFCMQYGHIPWWSGRASSYCKLWGSAAEFVKKANGPSVEYVGMGVGYKYLILFYQVGHKEK